jgi:hypothetical protein
MGGEPFCQCTHTALSPTGDIYVSDGYGNACVHVFSPDGRHKTSWGTLRHRPWPVQPAAQHRLRRTRLGLRRRPGKPPRPGLRRQREIPDRVAQPPPPQRPVLAARKLPALLRRRMRPDLRLQPQRLQPRPPRLDRQQANRRGHRPARRPHQGQLPRPLHEPARHRR